jgi:hypothetical protein
MGHLGQVVDLLLGEPGLLVLEREYLDGDLLLAQLTLPHGAEPASRLNLQQLYGPKQEAVKNNRLLGSLLRIHGILGWIRIRIRGSLPQTNGSGSCYFRY